MKLGRGENKTVFQYLDEYKEIKEALEVGKGKLQGRPEALSDKEYKQFAKSVAEGLSLTQLQKAYGLSRATVVRWKKRVLEEQTK